jgi:hypothetical protein
MITTTTTITTNGNNDNSNNNSNNNNDCAIAQSVSHRIPTAEVWVRTRVKSCGISGGHSGAGAGFLRVHRFPLPLIAPQ